MSSNNQGADWKQLALGEIASVKPQFITRHGWELEKQQEDNRVMLFVKMRHKHRPEQGHVLKLTYEEGFPKNRPRESFVNPDNYAEEGIAFWINDNNRAFKSNHNPPVICLEGTWGFHSVLHRDRDPMRATLNKLLLEVQKVFNDT